MTIIRATSPGYLLERGLALMWMDGAPASGAMETHEKMKPSKR